jgi:3-deoxy-manno-octulosonate cytidylyltransferase (CMP-KDO synthetase)
LNSGRAIAIVPVRLGSSRLPGKALLDESGLPLFAHTVQAARRSEKLDDVVVATDSPEVLRKGEELGIHCLETSEHPRTGSERCAEALAQLPDAEIVIDVQGDWPEVHGKDLDALVAALRAPGCEIATLSCPLDEAADFANPHVVKVVIAENGSALYFSRAPIPSCKSPEQDLEGWRSARRHVGIYGFRRATLHDQAHLRDGRGGLEPRQGPDRGRRSAGCSSARGLTIGLQKLDPYINVDPGTMNALPARRGLRDRRRRRDRPRPRALRALHPRGSPATPTTRPARSTTLGHPQGAARRLPGPHRAGRSRTSPTRSRPRSARVPRTSLDVAITEIGGTVGDIESCRSCEAIRQIALERPRADSCSST